MKLRASLLVLMALSGSLLAEGGSCPAGYYPVGGQGSQGCAPIPNYNGGGQRAQQPAVPRPTGYWERTWGAIAPSPVDGVLGAALGASSKVAAERLALADCKAKGGRACEVQIAYYNQCAVMTVGDKFLGTAHAGSIERATEIGIAGCQETDTDCRVYYSACTEPIFHRY